MPGRGGWWTCALSTVKRLMAHYVLHVCAEVEKTRASQRKLGATSLGHSKRHRGLRREPLASTPMAHSSMRRRWNNKSHQKKPTTFRIGNVCSFIGNKGYLCQYMWMTFKWAFSGNANQMKQSLNSIRRCSSHVFQLEATEKLPVWKTHAQTKAWSCDMEGHAPKCLERYCEMANKKVEQLYDVSHPSVG